LSTYTVQELWSGYQAISPLSSIPEVGAQTAAKSRGEYFNAVIQYCIWLPLQITLVQQVAMMEENVAQITGRLFARSFRTCYLAKAEQFNGSPDTNDVRNWGIGERD
jgi:hypothetical protein